jgi:hypothetical protein
VAWGGMHLVRAAGGADEAQLTDLDAALRVRPIVAAQAGGMEDMDAAADVVYGRSGGQR